MTPVKRWRNAIVRIAKPWIRPFVPKILRDLRQRHLARKMEDELRGKSLRDIFTTIYERRVWGNEDDFSSGTGSHAPELVSPYVEASREFLRSFAAPPDVVDIGCGDFNVGRQLRPLCGGYVACDVVPSLIERNKRVFAELAVDFRCVDICSEELPKGEVVFIRQVLQHLDNANIARVLAKMDGYRYLVVTEDVSRRPDFVPNVDQAAGPGIRAAMSSGVVVTAPPFSLRPISERLLCAVELPDASLRTMLYQLA